MTDIKNEEAGEKKSLNFIEQAVEKDLKEGKNGGKVQTRFPPEPNGYLHIGHAKAICLDFGIAEAHGGVCNLRFDDTNPTKEDVEYVEAIKEDIQWLGYQWGNEYYASDYFQQLWDFAIRLIQEGKAYIDEQTSEQIAQQKGTPTQPGVNGGRETPYEGEDRILVPSPKVATYDLKPEMSAYEVKDKLVGAINTQEYDFIVVNFANGDMVGHTGIYNAIAKAVHAVDNCVKDVIEAAKANDYEAIIIADHGNADHAINEDGTPNTAHSLNPVPFIYVTDNNSATVKDGRLADVAPSILHIMGLEQPADMTGENLIID